MSVRVLVVDDQEMFRVGLVAILAAHEGIEVVGQAGDGEAAIRRVDELRPDVVLMDVRMPTLDGIEATRRILADERFDPPPRVVVLTTFDADDYILAALRAGASGFLLKDATPDELVAAVRTVHGGDALLSPRVTRTVVGQLVAAAPRELAPPPELAALTERELEVLMLLASGLSNTEIADRLFIAEQTTKSHVSRILTKLRLRDRVHAVVLAYESGLVVPGRDA